ncbi:AraC family transcriptional regulator [Lichenibacterium ramalinae]|uniref:AraC family transcriptional regulator n=1 Tax=Lichenibacterium ramalinae TaxID=2316527 RepID=A0A4Q2R8L0_9HYPH|nr:AraC family transcriptional regulator [Lichenibacterium ramalinae]RYB02858.1 AraC family transcriptional regulator [Lichenibacterium ramalinae]
MPDPLAQVISLLRPSASFSKLVTGSGCWAVRPPATDPFYGAMLDGGCELSIAGREPLRLGEGDFMLVPAASDFTVTSLGRPPEEVVTEPSEVSPGLFHLGASDTPDVRMLVGHCAFGSPDAGLLVSLLPNIVVVRGARRLTTLVELLSEEAGADRPGRDAVLSRLLEVLLIEAFRATAEPTAAPGLLRGLADKRLAVALRLIHGETTRPWAIGDLARDCGLSRSTFCDRFRREVGVAPMAYLLGWRMAIARDLLRGTDLTVGEVSRRVGYGSASAFSVAFTRHVGAPPTTYARQHPQRGAA